MGFSDWKRRLPVAFAVGAAMAVLSATEVGTALEEDLGLAALYRVRGGIEPPADAAIVRLDRDSLLALRDLPGSVENWPSPLRSCARHYPALRGLAQTADIDVLPRSLYACVIDRLREAGAATIVFDVAFMDRPDRARGTSALAAAIRRHGRVVLLENASRLWLSPRAAHADAVQVDNIDRVAPSLAEAAAGTAPFVLPRSGRLLHRYWVRHVALPDPLQLPGRALEVGALDALERWAAGQGAVGEPTAAGLAARRATLVERFLQTVRQTGLPASMTAEDRMWLAAVRSIHDGPGERYFDYYGKAGTIASIGLWDLLSDDAAGIGPRSSLPLTGRTVFVGRADPQLAQHPDSFDTVLSTIEGIRISGVELAATAFLNLLHGQTLRTLRPWGVAAILFVLGTVLTLAACSGSASRGVFRATALAIAWACISVAAFVGFRTWLPLILPLLMALPAALLAGQLVHYVAAKQGLDRYLPRALARRVLSGERLRGEDVEVTVMFTDIVGFTAISERLQQTSVDAVRAFQNRHFALVVPLIEDQRGEIKEYTGDGLIAVWGWLESDADHATHACRAALDIAAALARDNSREREPQGPVRIRIGIHTGTARAGLLGGHERLNFTLTGDVLSATQRIEQLGKELCPDAPVAAILLSGETAARLGPGFALEPLGMHLLRGRARSHSIFRLREGSRERRSVTAAALLPLALLVGAAADPGWAAECPLPVARLVAADGAIAIDGTARRVGAMPVPLCAGSLLEVGERSRASVLYLGADTIARFDANSQTRILAPPEPESGLIELLRGSLFFISQVRRSLTVRTPYVTAGIEGTEVLIRLGDASGPDFDMRVYDGRVRLTAAAKSVPGMPHDAVETGERAVLARGEPLRVAAVEPPADVLRLAAARELAWTLYYPPLFAMPELAGPKLGEASRLLGSGQVTAAQQVLSDIPDSSTEAGLRDAVLSLVATIQGDPEQGLRLAETAAVRRPDRAAPLLAKSYAQQALRRLDDARAAAEAATAAEPDEALAWARVAEVALMFADASASRAAADRAVALGAPALVHVVQGFARLAAFRADAALASFSTALDRDDQQPLAHLGRGLALIRQGELREGRRELDVAAGLDPTRSLLRSYLGKAYFEERRDQDAGKQLAMAKRLDPNDPTPWFYDAIRKQLDNRPVEALHDLERSIALNDNRASFRSSLLLDQDRAVRSVSLGRIYDDLGFEKLGQRAATRALSYDPASSAAHRFLSDTYVGRPRLEAARASELLQSQLLQPLGNNPIQPSLAFTNLNLIAAAGPARVAFDEFAPLFTANGIHAVGTGEFGNHDTLGDEVAIYGLHNRVGFSLGQFRYDTDGFRGNNDLTHDIYDAFGQVAVTENLDVQAEYRHRKTEQGDRVLGFDPDGFRPNFEESIQQDVYRIGAHWRPAEGRSVVLSVMHADIVERDQDSPPDGLANTIKQSGEGTQAEGQFIGRIGPAQLVSGAGFVDNDLSNLVLLDDLFPLAVQPLPARSTSGYLYADLPLRETLMATLGLAYGDVRLGELKKTELQPKLGVRLEVSSALELRLAAFRTLKTNTLVSQSLEPTQVAGINQLYDDGPGTLADVIAAETELRLTSDLSILTSSSFRKMSAPMFDEFGRDSFEDATDRNIGASLQWTFADRFAFSAGITWNRFEQDNQAARSSPQRINTFELPVLASYFHPSGLFFSGGGSLLAQEIKTGEISPDDEFVDRKNSDVNLILSAAAGYRLPNRRGLISIEIANILDTKFDFQDDSFRSNQLANPARLPSRSILARATLAF